MAAAATPASVLVGGVDFQLTWPARVAPRLGVVLLLHQRLGSCGDLEALAERVAALGLLAVRWDAANHGARTVRAGANEHWLNGNLDSAIDMLSQMHATVAETRLWLDFGPAKLRLAFGAVGVLGLSQGAHSALLIAANEPRVDVCVAVLGAADYEMNMRLRHATFSKVLERRRSGGALPALAELMPPPLPAILARSDPVRRAAHMAGAGRAVLLLNGGADALVPVQCNEALFADLQRRLGEERAKMVVFPGVKHEVTEEMLVAALAWLAKFLPQGGPRL